MLVCHRPYRIISDRAALAAVVVLLLAYWLAPQPDQTFAHSADSPAMVIAPEPTQTAEQSRSFGFSELMLDLGLLLFLHR